ncbi:alpha/beta family hydrolase [Thalassotalea fonticola]|uniref:Alpha/beta family hydrolase n=1 Tax=Thalassotalea fonticola TaxID=3065649 RepID=A0ABZ0GSI5_9GAMM|nr:alpha/beta family hydrolase [Colwelliaceae bacterium S1-1]
MAVVDDLSIQMNTADDAIATLIFAHGAGANMDSDFMTEFTQLLNERHINVIRFNFPYMQQRLVDGKRRPPGKMDILKESYINRIKQYAVQLPLFIGGKSMGSRVAAMVANEDKVKGIVCIGYPFHPQKKPEKLRLEPLQQANKQVLIVQGDRDALGNQDEISDYALPTNIHVHYVADGDHDLKPRVKSGFTHLQHKISAANLIKTFIKEQS